MHSLTCMKLNSFWYPPFFSKTKCLYLCGNITNKYKNDLLHDMYFACQSFPLNSFALCPAGCGGAEYVRDKGIPVILFLEMKDKSGGLSPNDLVIALRSGSSSKTIDSVNLSVSDLHFLM